MENTTRILMTYRLIDLMKLSIQESWHGVRYMEISEPIRAHAVMRSSQIQQEQAQQNACKLKPKKEGRSTWRRSKVWLEVGWGNLYSAIQSSGHSVGNEKSGVTLQTGIIMSSLFWVKTAYVTDFWGYFSECLVVPFQYIWTSTNI